MRADTEGQVSAPTRVVSMGGSVSSVAAFDENLPENRSSVLADERCREALMMESSWCFASSSSSSCCSGRSPALGHLSMRMSNVVVGLDSQAKVCGKEEKKEKETEKKAMEDIPVSLSTTGSLVGCPGGDHLAQTHGAPCNGGTKVMGEVDGLEDYQESGVAGAKYSSLYRGGPADPRA